MITIEGNYIGQGQRIGIVLSRFNELIGERLLQGARDALLRHGVAEEDILLVRVPGAFELPIAVKALAAGGDVSAVIALGAVIRGETAHFDYVAGPMASGLASIALETGVPVLMGVLTTDTVEQAADRAGAKSGNKGAEVALGAIEMVNLIRTLREKDQQARPNSTHAKRL